MDGISTFEAIILYSVLLFPLISMLLLSFWTAANMKNTAKVQLIAIVILLAFGFLAINSSISLVFQTISIILLAVWIFAYRGLFVKGQIPLILMFFALQVAYYILLFVIGVEYYFGVTFLSIIPILSMILLYPWTFGKMKTSKGQVFILIVFIIQVIYAILTIVLSLIATSN